MKYTPISEKIKKQLKSNACKVLIQRADRVGDFILSLPLIEAIKAEFPLTKIGVLIHPMNEAIAKEHPLIDTIHSLNLNKKDKKKEIINTINTIKTKGYDIYFNLHNNPWCAYIGFLSRIPIRIGDRSLFFLRLLFTHTIKQNWENIFTHEINFNLNYLKPLTTQSKPPLQKLYTNPQEDQKAKILCQNNKKEHQDILTIFCSTGGSNQPIKESILYETITSLLKSNDYFIVLMYGFNDQQKQLQSLNHENLCNITKPTSLLSILSIIKQSNYYIGPDTGPTHMASFLKKPILSTWETPQNPPTRWGHFTPYQIILRNEYLPELKNTPKISEKHLLKSLEKLKVKVGLKNKEKNISLYFIKNSLRILICINTKNEYQDLKPFLKKCRKQNIIYKLHINRKNKLKNIKKQYQKTKRWNISIFQENPSKLSSRLIQLYFGIILAKQKPLINHKACEIFKSPESLLTHYQTLTN